MTEEEFEERVAVWHQGHTGQSLIDYLGLTWEEYASIVENPKQYWEWQAQSTKDGT